MSAVFDKLIQEAFDKEAEKVEKRAYYKAIKIVLKENKFSDDDILRILGTNKYN